MNDGYEFLVGHMIHDIVRIHDYIQLYLDDGGILNIYNVFDLEGCSKNDLNSLVGHRILSVEDIKNEHIRIYCEGGLNIRIGMSDNDYNGPEALHFSNKNGLDITWQIE